MSLWGDDASTEKAIQFVRANLKKRNEEERFDVKEFQVCAPVPVKLDREYKCLVCGVRTKKVGKKSAI